MYPVPYYSQNLYATESGLSVINVKFTQVHHASSDTVQSRVDVTEEGDAFDSVFDEL